MTHRLASAGVCVALLSLAACDRPEPQAAPVPEPASEGAVPAKASIIRPSVRAEIEARAPVAPEPVEARVLFDYGSAELSDASRAALDRVVATEGMVAEGWVVTLTGRTDSRGSAAANLRMANERAAAVRGYLVAAGVAAEQISVVAAGETGPAPDQDMDDDGAAARRVDVRAIPPGAELAPRA